MTRRLIAALAALVLTVIGTAVIVSYVSNADRRAMADLEPTAVLVVTEQIPAGTPAEQLDPLVSVEQLPASAVAAGAVTTVDALTGRVAQTALVPGEQVLAGRFVDPASLAVDSEVEVPEDVHQVTVQLDPARVVGGHLVAGDRVGVFISQAAQTHLVLHKVLVTRVQGGIAPAPTASDTPNASAAEPAPEPTPEPAPAASIMVTLAVDAPTAEKIVFGAEHARVWLSLEGPEAEESGTRIVTPENIYR